MAMNIIEVFSSNVRFYRMKLKLSQEALAEKANLHRTYISDIERGQRNVSLENIYNIAVALEIEPYMLLQKTDERNEVSAKYCYITHELRLHQNDRCKRFTPV